MASVSCAKCGTETFAGAHFCTVCGSELKAIAAESPQPAELAAMPFDLNLADIDQSFDALIGGSDNGTSSEIHREFKSSGSDPALRDDSVSGRLHQVEGKREHTMDNQDTPKVKRTIVEEGTLFRGTLSSSCPIDVRGRVDGEVETPALTVSASGAVHGKVKVGSVRSAGELSGEFDADTVELAGVVRDNTVVRARSMDVRLSSQRGKLQVIFGECGESPDARDATGAEPQPAALEQGFVATSSDDATAEPALTDEQPASASEDNGVNWQRGRRRGRGQRHSEPPPAVG